MRTEVASKRSTALIRKIPPKVFFRGQSSQDVKKSGPTDSDQLSRMTLIAGWFAERQEQAVFVVDKMLSVFLENSSARTVLMRVAALEVSREKLLFRSEKNRIEIKRVLDGEVDSISIAFRVAGGILPARFSRLVMNGENSGLFLLSIRVSGDSWRIELLQQEYRLTTAESEIALSIFNGASLGRIAQQRNASLNTVKTQVRNIFRKCRVHSKVDLTRRLGELAETHF